MRATSIIRVVLVLSLLGSISVAGTAIVWSTGERFFSAAVGEVASADAAEHATPAPADAHQPVQAGELEKQARNYRVRLDQNGRLPGRINVIDPNTGFASPARDLTIALLQNGQPVAEFRPGIDGIFEAEGILPGVYSLVAHGDEGYIAYGLEVLPAEFGVGLREGDNTSRVMFQEIEAALEIDSLAVPPTDGPAVLSLATEHLPPEIIARANEIAAEAETTPELPQVDPALIERVELDPAEDNPAEETLPSANLRQHEIRLAADGSLTGRMRSLNPQSGEPVRFRRLNVFLVKDNEIVAQAPVTPLGVFTFPDLQEGQYSFVAAGSEGFAAFSIRTVAEGFAGPETPDELIVPVAFTQPPRGPAFGFFGTLTSLEDIYYIYYWLRVHYGNDDDDGGGAGLMGGGPGAGMPLGQGLGPQGLGGAGGFGGGGGGFLGGSGGAGLFGGEGLGAALGLGVLGVAAAIIASDDDDNGRSSPQVPSPAIP